MPRKEIEKEHKNSFKTSKINLTLLKESKGEWVVIDLAIERLKKYL